MYVDGLQSSRTGLPSFWNLTGRTPFSADLKTRASSEQDVTIETTEHRVAWSVIGIPVIFIPHISTPHALQTSFWNGTGALRCHVFLLYFFNSFLFRSFPSPLLRFIENPPPHKSLSTCPSRSPKNVRPDSRRVPEFSILSSRFHGSLHRRNLHAEISLPVENKKNNRWILTWNARFLETILSAKHIFQSYRRAFSWRHFRVARLISTPRKRVSPFSYTAELVFALPWLKSLSWF